MTPNDSRGELTAALRRTASVAELLGEDLRTKIVFIGGAVLPLLQVEQDLLGSLRPTTDVDGLIRALTYTTMGRVEEELRRKGFRNDPGSRNIHKWIAPGQISFDLVSCGDHDGGTGSEIEAYAWETAVDAVLPPSIRHVNAVGFLALKCAAYRDRGAVDPIASKDLADIVSLIALRPDIKAEFTAAPQHVRTFVIDRVAKILQDPRAAGSIEIHLRQREPLVDYLEERVIGALRSLA